MATIFDFELDEPSELCSQLENVSLSVDQKLNTEHVFYDDDTETYDSVTELSNAPGIPIAFRNHRSSIGSALQPSSVGSTSGRLGKSFEIGIDKPFMSSFIEEPQHAELKRKKPSDFEQLKVLGTGTYGKVLLVRDKVTRKLYAQKQLKKASMIVEEKKVVQTKTEKEILESVRHPYIVKLFYAMQDQQKLYLILEYAQGGELFHHLASKAMLTDDTVSFYCAEMILALVHLHKNVGVVYRDLKPENCLLDAFGHLVLTDFGLSKVAAEDAGRCKTFLGTLEYMAPEVLLGQDYDYAVDWWSLGTVCYDLLTGKPPYPGNSSKMIMNKIKKSKRPDFPFFISADARDFMTKLLRKDPSKRLGFKDFDKIKKHRFFRKINWQMLENKDPELVPPIQPFITDPELAENFSKSFTDMDLSPPADGLLNTDAIPIPGKNGEEEVDHFKGFSFTASQSFIDFAR